MALKKAPSPVQNIVLFGFMLGLLGCSKVYTMSGTFNAQAKVEIDLMSMIDRTRMRVISDTLTVPRISVYYYSDLEPQARIAFSHVLQMRNIARNLLQSEFVPDTELYLLHVPQKTRLVFEERFKEPRRNDPRRYFTTIRLPIPFEESPDPEDDPLYAIAFFIATHEMVEMGLLNALGNVNHRQGNRWFFDGTAHYAGKEWYHRVGAIERQERVARNNKIQLWLLGQDVLEWTKNKPKGYYAASAQAVANLVEILHSKGMKEPIPHIIDTTPKGNLLKNIQSLCGSSFARVFKVKDSDIARFKEQLFRELASTDLDKSKSAAKLLQAMVSRLSPEEVDLLD